MPLLIKERQAEYNKCASDVREKNKKVIELSEKFDNLIPESGSAHEKFILEGQLLSAEAALSIARKELTQEETLQRTIYNHMLHLQRLIQIPNDVGSLKKMNPEERAKITQDFQDTVKKLHKIDVKGHWDERLTLDSHVLNAYRENKKDHPNTEAAPNLDYLRKLSVLTQVESVVEEARNAVVSGFRMIKDITHVFRSDSKKLEKSGADLEITSNTSSNDLSESESINSQKSDTFKPQ